MKVKTIPEKLFVRKINTEALTYLPDDLTYSIQFEPKKNKRKYIKGYGKRGYWRARPESELLQERKKDLEKYFTEDHIVDQLLMGL